ncbi:MAG TPA: cytidylate kinase-like family protein [Gemmatimonadaceae bacterium]
MAIITISRLYGSGGSEVAAQVARELGWSLLDNAVVDQVAARLGITRAQVAAREERVPSLVERIADALTLGSQEWITPMTAARRGPTDEQLIEMTRHVVDEAVAAGPLVIVGRGAQAMLAERADALHVFCHAPRAALISRVMERERLGADEAAALVDETNAHREMWVKSHWDRSWKRPENYHLSINTGWLGIQGASDVIVFAARSRFGL